MSRFKTPSSKFAKQLQIVLIPHDNYYPSFPCPHVQSERSHSKPSNQKGPSALYKTSRCPSDSSNTMRPRKSKNRRLPNKLKHIPPEVSRELKRSNLFLSFLTTLSDQRFNTLRLEPVPGPSNLDNSLNHSPSSSPTDHSQVETPSWHTSSVVFAPDDDGQPATPRSHTCMDAYCPVDDLTMYPCSQNDEEHMEPVSFPDQSCTGYTDDCPFCPYTMDAISAIQLHAHHTMDHQHAVGISSYDYPRVPLRFNQELLQSYTSDEAHHAALNHTFTSPQPMPSDYTNWQPSSFNADGLDNGSTYVMGYQSFNN